MMLLSGFADNCSDAIFDTGYYATWSELAWRCAFHRRWSDSLHMWRCGIHDILEQSIAGHFARLNGGDAISEQVVVRQVGSGATVCAMLGGVSVVLAWA